ncbi:hypothetical protein FJTKL_11675 [Diaporthe vaccinii]|uniref:Ankyrin repeat protein n=1 Tax=Diaporthe vaccinii TaxID=105482 RepID=A0ABR4EFT6_9PEZI
MQQYDTVQFLVGQGAQIDDESYEHVWDFVLRRKCSKEQEDGLRCITEAKDRDWIEDQSFPPVHKIVLGLSTKRLHQELQKNPDAVYATDAQGRTALDWATARAQSNHMKLLIHQGSNYNAMDSKGRSTVLHAVDSHNPEALRIILEAGASADPVILNGSKRSSPLTSASFGGLAEMVRLLLHYGANINASNPEGRTALHSVASTESVECAEILLDRGANINEVSSNGCTPLMTAIRCNAHSVLKLFLDRHPGFLDGASLLETIHRYADKETISILKTHRLDPSESGTLAPSVDYASSHALADLHANWYGVCNAPRPQGEMVT